MTGGDFTWLGPNPGIHGWAMATAAVVSASCALVGSLLVVRRMSLLGDAIGHAVLPGIAVAVLAGAASAVRWSSSVRWPRPYSPSG